METQKQGCHMVGMLDIKGQDQCRRVYGVDGIAPTLTTSGGGQRQVKILDTKRLRVRKLTPNEYGVLQAFKMDSWVQVVSDSQAYKQFGNAVTVSLFEAIATNIKIAILAADESEELNMENQTTENKGFAMNPPTEENEVIQAETPNTTEGPATVTEPTQEVQAEDKPNIDTYELAAEVIKFLYDAGYIPRACMALDETPQELAKHLETLFGGKIIGEPKEEGRDWQKAREELEKALDEYASLGPAGMYGIKGLTPLKVRLDQGEKTPDLFNAIVAAVR